MLVLPSKEQETLETKQEIIVSSKKSMNVSTSSIRIHFSSPLKNLNLPPLSRDMSWPTSLMSCVIQGASLWVCFSPDSVSCDLDLHQKEDLLGFYHTHQYIALDWNSILVDWNWLTDVLFVNNNLASISKLNGLILLHNEEENGQHWLWLSLSKNCACKANPN